MTTLTIADIHRQCEALLAEGRENDPIEYNEIPLTKRQQKRFDNALKIVDKLREAIGKPEWLHSIWVDLDNEFMPFFEIRLWPSLPRSAWSLDYLWNQPDDLAWKNAPEPGDPKILQMISFCGVPVVVTYNPS